MKIAQLFKSIRFFRFTLLLALFSVSLTVQAFEGLPKLRTELEGVNRAHWLIQRLQAVLTAEYGYEWQTDFEDISIWMHSDHEPGAISASSVGSSIHLTSSALTTLTDQELMGVLAHEVAHIERGDFFENLSDGIFYLPGALASDSFAEGVFLGKEMTADCVAYKWLRALSLYENYQPEAIAWGLKKQLYSNYSVLSDNPTVEKRYNALLNGAYKTGRCD